MAPLLDRMERWLTAERPDYFGSFQSGVTDDQLNAFEARFGVVLPSGFRDLYRWRNGQNDSCSESLQMNYMFSPLDGVADTKSDRKQ